jgi:hypothetical protein
VIPLWGSFPDMPPRPGAVDSLWGQVLPFCIWWLHCDRLAAEKIREVAWLARRDLYPHPPCSEGGWQSWSCHPGAISWNNALWPSWSCLLEQRAVAGAALTVANYEHRRTGATWSLYILVNKALMAECLLHRPNV